MIDDMPEPTTPTTTPTPTTPPPVGDAIPTPELRKKRKKDQVGMKLHTRPTVSIQELCADLKVNCTVARKKLRDAGIPKSLCGIYEWQKGTPEYKKVRKLLVT
jgi:hypothetical protein